MAAFSDLEKEAFNTQRDQWEKALQSELKLQDLKGKTTKKNLDVGEWPTLSLESDPAQLGSQVSWKKAAQTYHTYQTDLKASLQDDLNHGVRAFFFTRKGFTQEIEATITQTIGSFPDASDVEKYFLEDILVSREVHQAGGNVIQELGVTLVKYIEQVKSQKEINLGVYMDSRFFSNIAKLRALRLLILKVHAELEIAPKVKLIALNSYREWTLYERYSNLLRNDSQVASALIGGADVIQSSGYESVFELESHSEPDHLIRSRRMARNTSHILALESMLGIVGDAAYGSYHLEGLTQKYAQGAWEFMQKIISLDENQRTALLASEVEVVRETRKSQLKTRRYVMAGTNDYAHRDEKLGPSTQVKESFFRTAREFEELRLRVEKLEAIPQVEIKLKGDYASLSARINFIKNYFELIGLEVIDPAHGRSSSNSTPVIVLCAADSDYLSLVQEVGALKSKHKFVAGKVDVPGFTSIYADQDIYQVLKDLVVGLNL